MLICLLVNISNLRHLRRSPFYFESKQKIQDCYYFYRTITLFNVGTKILTATLARRLQDVIPSIIHPSPSRFMKKEIDGVWQYLPSDLYDWCQNIKYCKLESVVLIPLDNEKLFDMKSALRRYGSYCVFVHWIILLSSSSG